MWVCVCLCIMYVACCSWSSTARLRFFCARTPRISLYVRCIIVVVIIVIIYIKLFAARCYCSCCCPFHRHTIYRFDFCSIRNTNKVIKMYMYGESFAFQALLSHYRTQQATGNSSSSSDRNKITSNHQILDAHITLSKALCKWERSEIVHGVNGTRISLAKTCEMMDRFDSSACKWCVCVCIFFLCFVSSLSRIFLFFSFTSFSRYYWPGDIVAKAVVFCCLSASSHFSK